jgi:hypothetical protein
VTWECEDDETTSARGRLVAGTWAAASMAAMKKKEEEAQKAGQMYLERASHNRQQGEIVGRTRDCWLQLAGAVRTKLTTRPCMPPSASDG